MIEFISAPEVPEVFRGTDVEIALILLNPAILESKEARVLARLRY